MATIYREIPLDRTAADVWAGIADLGAVNQLIDFLGDVTVDGDVRRCSLGDAGELEELIVTVDHERQRLVYSIRQSPFGLTHHSASMQVVADEAGSRLVWTTDLLPDALAGALTEPVDAAAASIARHFAQEQPRVA